MNFIKTSSQPHESSIAASSRLFLFCEKIMSEVIVTAYPYQTYPMGGYGNHPMNGYGQQQNGYYQPNPRDGIIRITGGMEGAKAYQMPPNSREALFDDTDDIVIFKATDGVGFPSYKSARLMWMDDEKQAPAGDYLTREEFVKWKEDFERGQQIIRRRRTTEPAVELDAAENGGT